MPEFHANTKRIDANARARFHPAGLFGHHRLADPYYSFGSCVRRLVHVRPRLQAPADRAGFGGVCLLGGAGGVPRTRADPARRGGSRTVVAGPASLTGPRLPRVARSAPVGAAGWLPPSRRPDGALRATLGPTAEVPFQRTSTPAHQHYRSGIPAVPSGALGLLEFWFAGAVRRSPVPRRSRASGWCLTRSVRVGYQVIGPVLGKCRIAKTWPYPTNSNKRRRKPRLNLWSAR